VYWKLKIKKPRQFMPGPLFMILSIRRIEIRRKGKGQRLKVKTIGSGYKNYPQIPTTNN
jgi:hypothetical protein